MSIDAVAVAALLFGLILEVSAANLYRQRRPRGETLPLVIIGGIFLVVGLFQLLV